MEKIEQEFVKASIRYIESKHTFIDLNGKINYGAISVKSKRMPLWGKIAIPSASAIIAAGVAALIILSNTGLLAMYPSLDLSQYKVNLNDAEGIGIIPFGDKKVDTFVKRVEGTGKVEAVNFLSKKNSKPSNKLSSRTKTIAKLQDENTFDEFAKTQDELGWVVANYLVYDDQFTFVQFVPKKQYFKYVYNSYSHETASPDVVLEIDASFAYNAELYYGEPIGGERAAFYHLNDTNPNHYYNGKFLVTDTQYFSDKIHKSYVIDNQSGYIYSLADLNSRLYYRYDGNFIYLVNKEEWRLGSIDYRTGIDEIVNFSISDSNELLVNTIDNFPNAEANEIKRDRYGQYFIQTGFYSGADYDRKIYFTDDVVFLTSDNRALFIKNSKLYEFKDNFEIVEVDDNTTYKPAGFYSDYGVINNKYIFNVGVEYPYLISIIDGNEIEARIASVALGDYYFNLKDGELYYFYTKNPVIELFRDSEPQTIKLFDNIKSIDYQSDFIVKEFDYDNTRVPMLETVSSLYAYNTIKVTKWTTTGDIQYTIYLDENNELSIIESDKYVQEQKEYVLTPINQ